MTGRLSGALVGPLRGRGEPVHLEPRESGFLGDQTESTLSVRHRGVGMSWRVCYDGPHHKVHFRFRTGLQITHTPEETDAALFELG